MMLAGLSFEWAMIFTVLALMAGFLVGQALDGVMGRLAFGPAGNMAILTAGFFLGAFIFERTRLGGGLEIQFVVAIAAAFLLLLLLATVKRVMIRL